MLRIFLVLIFCFTSLLLQAAAPQTLEQINADLLAKKSQDEPFKDKDVKVDLESLGLDDIDAKNDKNTPPAKLKKVVTQPKTDSVPLVPTSAPSTNIATPTTANSATKPTPNPLPEATPIEEIKKSDLEKSKLIAPQSLQDKIKSMQNKVTNNPLVTNSVTKIQNFLHKTPEEKIANDPINPVNVTEAPATENPKGGYVNDLKKRNLKKQAAAKKAAKKKAEANEKERRARLAKLNQLRQQYLLKIKSDRLSGEKNLDEDLMESEEKIRPQRKNINKFVTYETPAPPILSRYRSYDNGGIPLVISDREKGDILFRAVALEDISYFNSAYSDIEEPNLRNAAGDTILTYALLLQKREAVASILAKGADPDLPNSLGYTPLQITIESLDYVSFNLLVNRNADVNVIDGFGKTYLMHAARVGFLPAMETLIKNGVDINAMDYDGFTALAIANRYKQDLAVALLLKYGAKPWVEKPYDPESESIIKQLENKWKR